MNSERQLGQVVNWLFQRTTEQAPPPPRADDLLGESLPWWEAQQTSFQKLLERLKMMPVTYGHASPDRAEERGGRPIACILVRDADEAEVLVHPIYFSVRHNRLRFRFLFEAEPSVDDRSLEVAFALNEPGHPPFSAIAVRSVQNEYSLEATLTPLLGEQWREIKVTQAMPFRLVARRLDDGRSP